MAQLTRRSVLTGAAASCVPLIHTRATQVAAVSLVLALDVSASVPADRWHVQRQGYASAFSSREVQNAILGGPVGIVAVTLVQWSGISEQEQVVPWTLLCDKPSIMQFADVLSGMKRCYSGQTALGRALRYSTTLFQSCPVEAMKRVIDVSGDGPENVLPGSFLSSVREEILASGVIINGLPLAGAPRDELAPDGIAVYYAEKVIGGPGSFSIAVENPGDIGVFTQALKQKLVTEIA